MKSHVLYEISKNGKLKRLRKECPRCRGCFLAEHKDRRSCGKCGYSEFKK
ncbi:MAG: 30S ribosomal protein S27ae [Promethearchaeota archaeon]